MEIAASVPRSARLRQPEIPCRDIDGGFGGGNSRLDGKRGGGKAVLGHGPARLLGGQVGVEALRSHVGAAQIARDMDRGTARFIVKEQSRRLQCNACFAISKGSRPHAESGSGRQIAHQLEIAIRFQRAIGRGQKDAQSRQENRQVIADKARLALIGAQPVDPILERRQTHRAILRHPRVDHRIHQPDFHHPRRPAKWIEAQFDSLGGNIGRVGGTKRETPRHARQAEPADVHRRCDAVRLEITARQFLRQPRPQGPEQQGEHRDPDQSQSGNAPPGHLKELSVFKL